MKVIVANCRYEGVRIMLPFQLSNLVPELGYGHTSLIWEGQIDTGFDGYIMMPFSFAQRNNLQLASSSGTWTVANGESMPTIDSLGKVTLVGRSGYVRISSPVNQAAGEGILIGQKMLETLNLKLESDPVNKIAQLVVPDPPASN